MLGSHLIKTAFADPMTASLLLLERLAPQALHTKYSSLCRSVGMDGPGFVLSFDCDTEKDFEVVGDVHARLNDIGVMPVYAVPGELLQRGEKYYLEVAKTGAEFINHGYAEHTIFDEEKQQYFSTLYYHLIGREAVRRDVILGHEAVLDVLGTAPRGFRTPHFGSYQKSQDLCFLHRVLESLSYRYSSSTVPLYGIRFGPLFNKFGIAEIPVTGCQHWPATILDSFTFRYSASTKFTPEGYVQQVALLAAMLEEEQQPYLVNIYADPSQVYDWPEFFSAMKKLSRYNIPSYSVFLDGLTA